MQGMWRGLMHEGSALSGELLERISHTPMHSRPLSPTGWLGFCWVSAAVASDDASGPAYFHPVESPIGWVGLAVMPRVLPAAAPGVSRARRGRLL